MTMSSILEFFRDQPVITLFLALAAGYLVGRARVAGLSLGAVAGTLIVSLILGNLGFHISPGAQAVGFAMFIFAVGYQAGPRFIEVLKTQGLRYFALALFVAGVGFFAAVLAGKWLSLPCGGTAGLLAGALTTTPTLAAAQEAVRAGIASIPAGVSAEQVTSTIGASYAITYIVGLLGVIAAVRLLPRILRLDLEAEARKLEGVARGENTVQLQARAYRVSREEYCRMTVGELAARLWDGLAVVRFRRAGEPFNPSDVAKGIITFENGSGWSWGSSFFFVDILKSDGEDSHATEVYAEWFPSASLSKLLGKDFTFGFVRDVSVTMGINAGTKNTGAAPRAFLPG